MAIATVVLIVVAFCYLGLRLFNMRYGPWERYDDDE